MAQTNGSHLDTRTLEQWAATKTLPEELLEVDGLAQEVRDAIPDDQIPDDLDSALFRLT